MRAANSIVKLFKRHYTRQIEKVRREENRSRSELLREAWRLHFDSRYPAVTPAKGELAAIHRGRAEIKAGRFVTLEQLNDELATQKRKSRSKSSRKKAAP